MSAFNPETFLAAQRATVDTLLSVANTALASAERVAALNLHAAREAIEDIALSGKAALLFQHIQQSKQFFSQIHKAQHGLMIVNG